VTSEWTGNVIDIRISNVKLNSNVSGVWMNRILEIGPYVTEYYKKYV